MIQFYVSSGTSRISFKFIWYAIFAPRKKRGSQGKRLIYILSHLMSNMPIIYSTRKYPKILMFQELFKSYLPQVLLLGLRYREATVLGTISSQNSEVPYVLLDSFQSINAGSDKFMLFHCFSFVCFQFF